MTANDFLNKLKVMMSIDMHELVDAGVIDHGDFVKFRVFSQDPYTFMMKASDDAARKIYAIIAMRTSPSKLEPAAPNPVIAQLINVAESYVADLRNYDLNPEQRTNRIAYVQASLDVARRADQ